MQNLIKNVRQMISLRGQYREKFDELFPINMAEDEGTSGSLKEV